MDLIFLRQFFFIRNSSTHITCLTPSNFVFHTFLEKNPRCSRMFLYLSVNTTHVELEANLEQLCSSEFQLYRLRSIHILPCATCNGGSGGKSRSSPRHTFFKFMSFLNFLVKYSDGYELKSPRTRNHECATEMLTETI